MLITFTSDFGNADGYAAIMKGVAAGIAPAVTLIDITHEVPPGDIRCGSWILNNAYRYFPQGSVHVAVVDPGVGTQRRGVVLAGEGHVFVGPDNGLFTDVVFGHKSKAVFQVFEIDNPEYFRPEVSTTFHGRDIFAPVAAHIFCGARLDAVGSAVPLESLVTFRRPGVARIGNRVVGEVVHVDRFGNLITNIPACDLDGAQLCLIGDLEIPIGTTYGQVPPGQPVAYKASHGFAEIGVFQGSASQVLGLGREVKIAFALRKP